MAWGNRTLPGLSAEGSRALGPAWPQPAAPPRQRPAAQAVGSKLARLDLDVGRALWMRGNSERLNRKDLNERNAFFIFCSEERGSGIKEKCSLNGRKMLLAHLGTSRPAAFARGGWHGIGFALLDR